MSIGYYSRIEQHRGARPSEPMLAALARGPHLSLDATTSSASPDAPPPASCASNTSTPVSCTSWTASRTPRPSRHQPRRDPAANPARRRPPRRRDRTDRPGPQHVPPLVHPPRIPPRPPARGPRRTPTPHRGRDPEPPCAPRPPHRAGRVGAAGRGPKLLCADSYTSAIIAPWRTLSHRWSSGTPVASRFPRARRATEPPPRGSWTWRWRPRASSCPRSCSTGCPDCPGTWSCTPPSGRCAP
ncbi:hypothetical protein ACFVTW_00990 [Streptomyces liangshanensis]|uniref:hypothetical protein n=1 Tax=Streptomyces liangshanensis TaxID=2717324 RepID=UPI0036DE88FF